MSNMTTSSQNSIQNPEAVGEEYPFTEREWKRLNEIDAQERRGTVKLGLILVLLSVIAAIMVFLVYLVVFRSHDYDLVQTYNRNHAVLGIPDTSVREDTAAAFASDLCVTDRDINLAAVSLQDYSAGLFDLDSADIIYAKDLFTTRSPASLTKIMTALVAIRYGNMDDIVTVTDTALNIEYGSSVCDIKVGDRVSMKQLVYGMMIASGNDAAMMIAEHVGGSVDYFVEMMNREALEIGATRTHFVNPHGLTDSNHYTCAYDIYLMFREAMKYDMFMDIISRSNFYAEYTNADGNAAAVTWETTNHYFTGEADVPDNVLVYGGKTGTTDDAGACLALLTKDLYGNPFLAVILHSPDKDLLYDEMNHLLSLVPSEAA